MINAFKQVRLTNSLIQTQNNRLLVNSETGALLSDLNNASGILDAQIQSTGSYLYGLINASSAGVGSINGASGSINFTGAGNTSVIVNGQTITISGNTGAYINFATNTNLASTGQILYNDIIGFSGQTALDYAKISNLVQTGIILDGRIDSLSGWASSSRDLASTGSALYNDIIGLSGQALSNYSTIANLTQTGVLLEGKINSLSGYSASATNLYSTGSALYNIIQTYSGNSQSFTTGINQTGFDSYLVTYPLGPFPTVPRINCTIEVSGNVMYMVNITGRSANGFWALFSDIISESGVVLHTYATINN